MPSFRPFWTYVNDLGSYFLTKTCWLPSRFRSPNMSSMGRYQSPWFNLSAALHTLPWGDNAVLCVPGDIWPTPQTASLSAAQVPDTVRAKYLRANPLTLLLEVLSSIGITLTLDPPRGSGILVLGTQSPFGCFHYSFQSATMVPA